MLFNICSYRKCWTRLIFTVSNQDGPISLSSRSSSNINLRTPHTAGKSAKIIFRAVTQSGLCWLWSERRNPAENRPHYNLSCVRARVCVPPFTWLFHGLFGSLLAINTHNVSRCFNVQRQLHVNAIKLSACFTHVLYIGVGTYWEHVDGAGEFACRGTMKGVSINEASRTSGT